MTSVPEIAVQQVRLAGEGENDADEERNPPFGAWALEGLPASRRPSPASLTVLAVAAGVGAMVLGALAVVSATQPSTGDAVASPPPREGAVGPTAEQRVLSLLGKPSTARIAFRGTAGRLVLVVGSTGRAAILVRGFRPAHVDSPYYAWVVRSGTPVRAARVDRGKGTVFLSTRVDRGNAVVVATARPGRAARGAIVAARP